MTTHRATTKVEPEHAEAENHSASSRIPRDLTEWLTRSNPFGALPGAILARSNSLGNHHIHKRNLRRLSIR